MQALIEQKSIPRKLLVFPMPMRTTPSPQNPSQERGQRHGNTAQIVTGIIAVLAFIGTIYNACSTHQAEDFGLRVDKQIDAKLSPAFEKLGNRVDVLSNQIFELNGQIKQLNEDQKKLSKLPLKFQQLDAVQKNLKGRIDQQEALARLQDPNRILATIRIGIQTAESRREVLPSSQLTDYKIAVRALPASAFEYWTTVAAIINYQSLLNQMSGQAPDPAKVSRPCWALTGGQGNLFVGGTYADCIVDLDTQGFANVTFRDSVVRYKGGAARISNVRFENCRFVLDFAPQAKPEKPEFLFALLDSPNQKIVKVE